MIRIFDIAEDFDAAAEFWTVMPHIPKWRLDKAMSYRFDIDRFLCVKSFLMLENMLREHFGLVGCPEFSYDGYGKPYFRDYPELFINISHCWHNLVNFAKETYQEKAALFLNYVLTTTLSERGRDVDKRPSLPKLPKNQS